MNEYLIQGATLADMADAIREVKGTSESVPVSTYASEIRAFKGIGGGQSEKPFNLVSYINGTLTEIDDTYGVIKSVGLYWSSSYYSMSSYYSVGGLSFMNNSQLKTVNLPECISVYNFAFLSCSSLEYVSLPKCEYVAIGAFSSCDNLSRLDLPACKSIASYAIGRSSKALVSLQINVPDYCELGFQSVHSSIYGSVSYWSANGNPYGVCYSINWRLGANVTLHSRCFTICQFTSYADYVKYLYGEGVRWVCGAFKNNSASQLAEISFPNCERINDYAFYSSCKALATLNLPKCSYIGANAFYTTSLITDISNIPVMYIGAGAFYNARSISIANWSIIEYLGKGAFYGNTVFTELPSELTNCSYLCGFTGSPVLEKAHHSTAKTICFQSCSVLSDISFPACEVLESYAFYSCPNLVLTGEEFPECRVVGSSAFTRNLSIPKMIIPKCERIENNAFVNCSSLSQITIDNCEYIGSSAFYECIALEYLDAPKCTYISSSAFMYCSNLSYINLPECLVLEEKAFDRCPKLASISLPKLKRLGSPNAVYPTVFSGCSFIQELDLPELEELVAHFSNTNIHTLKLSKVKVIGTSAFSYAKSVFSIYIYANSVPVLKESYYGTFVQSPFNGGTGRIYVPSSMYDEYRMATNWAAAPSTNLVSF